MTQLKRKYFFEISISIILVAFVLIPAIFQLTNDPIPDYFSFLFEFESSARFWIAIATMGILIVFLYHGMQQLIRWLHHKPMVRNILLGCSVIVAFITLYSISSESTLPFLRYKSVANSDSVVSLNFQIIKSNKGSFYCDGSFCILWQTRLKPWFGDQEDRYHEAYGVIVFDGAKHFSGYDTSLISFSKEYVYPKRVGSTNLLLHFNGKVYTYVLKIYRHRDSFEIQVHKSQYGALTQRFNLTEETTAHATSNAQ